MSDTTATVIDSVFRRFDAADLTFGHGADNAWDEAVALVLHVTGLSDQRESLETTISNSDLSTINQLAQRRIVERVPLAYLFGECTYVGLSFVLEPGVMIPRSPIGHLLRDERLDPWLHEPARILDLCSGTGCLGIVAALQFPNARVTLVELDQQALAVAKHNVARHGLESRIEVVAGDVTSDGLDETLRGSWAGTWDLILSNPPYVDDETMANRAAEYYAEPAAGLAGGGEGLDIIDAILRRLPTWLAAQGVFVCEVGESAPAFQRNYPQLDVVWLDLPSGGEGVFLLEAKQVHA